MLGVTPAEVRSEEDETSDERETAPASPDAAAEAATPPASTDAAPAAVDSGPPNPCSKYGTNTKYCNGKCVYVDDPAYGCRADTCMPCIVAHATAVCGDGACVIAQCMDDYLDCNAKASDGCEYEPPNDGDTCAK